MSWHLLRCHDNGRMKTVKKLICLFLSVVMAICLCACEKSKKESKADSPVLVMVNGEPIFKAEIDPVYEEYRESDVTYEQIIEDTIDEVLVIQQAPKYKLSVSEADIDENIEFYKASYPELYQELFETYTEEEIRKKLGDRALFSTVRDYALKHICPIDHELIEEFANEYELEEQLKSYTDDQLKYTLNSELQNFAIKQWVKELRVSAEIVYAES